MRIGKSRDVVQKVDQKEGAYFFLISLFFIYFVARLCFYALTIPLHIPPDEVTHFGFCTIFSQFLGFPVNTEATYSLGNVARIPWFYYFLMGKLLSFNVLPISDLLFLRLINVFITFCIVLYSFRWISIVTDHRLVRLFFLIILTNIPMFTFLGASVSYDNLVNLCAVMMLYYLHLFFMLRKPVYALAAGNILLIGALCKISFLPLVPIVMGIVVFHERKKLVSCCGVSLSKFMKLTGVEKGLCVTLLLLLVFCAELYVGNIWKFQKIVPSPSQIMTESQFMQQRIVARDFVISKYRTGEWDYDQAVKGALEIPHPGDQRTALYVLKNIASSASESREVMSRLAYAPSWLKNILATSVGLSGHRSMLKTGNQLAIYQAIFLLAFLITIRCWEYGRTDLLLNQCIVIVLSYILYLFLFHNYIIYLWSMSPTLGVQGRYIFPVLVPLVGVLTCFFVRFFSGWYLYLAVCFVSLFFIWGDFPYFNMHVDERWSSSLEDDKYHYNRGDLLKTLGDSQGAVVEFQKAILLQPDNAWYRRFLGDAYDETGLKQKALKQYKAAVSLQPEVADFHYLAGRINQDLGMVEHAIEHYQAAVELDPMNVWYHRFLGDVYKEAGDYTKAAQQYKRVLYIDPGNVYCQRQLSEGKDKHQEEVVPK